MWKDDKSYLYIGITKESLPRIFITHQPFDFAERRRRTLSDEQGEKSKDLHSAPLRASPKIEYIGPFVDGKAIKTTLRLLRQVFPYYTAKKHSSKPCQYCHLGLCPGPNPDPREYRKNIRGLKQVLQGKRKGLLQGLKREMARMSQRQKFEKAAQIRNQVFALEDVLANARIFSKTRALAKTDWGKTQKELREILKTKGPISRIEAYDIANIQGKQATGSMVVFTRGKPDKNQYRQFRIKLGDKPNDVAMIKETLTRRFSHSEWPYPQVILIDGGKAQLNAAMAALKSKIPASAKATAGKQNPDSKILVMALAKKHNELFIEGQEQPFLLKSLPREIFNLVLQLRDEAHRFAHAYHLKLRKKKFLYT
jgi:excinuclease ABC subunit C